MNTFEFNDKYKDLKLYMTSSDTTGCSGYRVRNPYEFLKPYYEFSQFHEGFPMQDKIGHEWADVIFLQRVNHELFLQLIPYLRSKGKKIVMDMDDNLFEIPRGNLARVHYDDVTLKRITEIMSLCDCLICSTEPLAHYYSQWNKNIFISPNMIKNVFDFKEHTKKDKTRIGWCGSYTHAFEFPDGLDRHLKMLTKYDKIQSVVSGFDGKLPKQEHRTIPDLFKYSEKHGWVAFTEWLDYMNNLNLDIGYAVVQTNVFNECKSDIKFLEYSACSVPMLAMSCYAYDNTIEHEKTGYIIKSKNDWKKYINLLIEDYILRNEISFNAWDYIKMNRTYQYAGNNVLDIYYNVFEFLYEGKTDKLWKNYDVKYFGKKE